METYKELKLKELTMKLVTTERTFKKTDYKKSLTLQLKLKKRLEEWLFDQKFT